MHRVRHILGHIDKINAQNSIISINNVNSSQNPIFGGEFGGYLIAKVLLSEGVSHVFTLTGGHISPILVGCSQIGINVVDVRDEVTTVFAADAVGRITGKPGVGIVTAGPGLTNTITAVKNAQMAESPVIIFGGATSQLLKGRGSLQDIDQIALMKPHVKACYTLRKVRDIIPTLREAFYISNHGIPGPVFIETPLEILWPRSEIQGSFDAQSGSKSKGGLLSKLNPVNLYLKYFIYNTFKDGFKDLNNISMIDRYKYITSSSKSKHEVPSVDSKIVSIILNKLLHSNNPLIVIGSQTMIHPSLINDLKAAIESLSIPIYLSGMSRGLFGESHELYYRHKRTIALSKCDFLLLCGVSMDFRLGYGRSINKNAFYVHINLDKYKLKINNDLRKRNYGIYGDSCKFLIKLNEKKKDLGFNLMFNDWKNELKKREYMREMGINKTMKNEMKYNDNSSSMNSINLCKILNKLIVNQDTYLVADGGDFVGTASYLVKPRLPLHWLDPGAFGTLGCGAGFAIGIKSIYPKSDLIILFGDGSVGWSLSEFDTFRRHKLGCIAIIGNDSCWHQMYRDQVRILKDTTATLLAKDTRYDKVVEGFGCKGFLVRNEKEFIDSFKESQTYAKQGIPCLINVIITKSKFREGSISL